MRTEPLTPITPQHVSDFDRDGVVCLRGMFDAAWVEHVESGIEKELATPGPRLLEQQPDDAPGRFVTDYCPAQYIGEFQDFVLASPAAEVAARLMGSETGNYLMDLLWIKEPGTEKRTSWHHDQPYFCVDGRQLCSIWFPVDPVPQDVSLRFIRGSHNWGRWFRPQLTRHGQNLYHDDRDTDLSYESIPDFDASIGDYQLLSWATEPGDCIVFHGLTVHSSPGNPQVDCRRRVISTVWFGDDATFGRRPSPPRPRFEGHGLEPGDRMVCACFPRVWPRPRDATLAQSGAARFSQSTPLRISI